MRLSSCPLEDFEKMDPRHHRRFAIIVRREDADIDLGEATLLLGALETPDLNLPPWLARLDELADELRSRLGATANELEQVSCLTHFLFVEKGFRGNRGDYYDPRNSFLHQVLRRRLGIPVSLAVVAMEVGRRVGVPLEGVGFPGHFLLRHSGQRHLILDPFDGGEILTPGELTDLLRRLSRNQAMLQAHHLASVGSRSILQRMLRNLKAIYLSRRQLQPALAVLDLLLLLDPNDPESLRDRGLLQVEGGEARQGLRDLRRYLDVAPPDAEDRQVVKKYIHRAQGSPNTVH